jgi:hypothetical protein
VVIAGVWQSSGFVMALFLAGLRGIDDPSSRPPRWMAPACRDLLAHHHAQPAPGVLQRAADPAHIAIKSFDLVMALTGRRPRHSSTVPAIFMYQFAFTRGQLGLGSASAMMMLATIVAVLVPLMYLETRSANVAKHRHSPPHVLYAAGPVRGVLPVPLYVMLSTSFKTLDDIRSGNLLALPQCGTSMPGQGLVQPAPAWNAAA